MHGATLYQLHLLLDKHADEQNELIDKIADACRRSEALRSRPSARCRLTKIRRAPNGCEEVPAMLSRLLEAH